MDEDDVTITNTATSIYGKDVVVSYIVTGIKASKKEDAMEAVESSSLASSIEKDLKEEGYKKVDVEKADADVTTVIVVNDINDDMTDVTVPALVASQSFAGVTLSQALEPSFQATLLAAVADKLDVDVDDVVITNTATSINGKDVVVEYQVTGWIEEWFI